jgi:hypothetical protein
MEVLQIIQGREAVPVRAIPFLTGLRKMSPDVVAQALAGMNHNGKFVGFTAYKLRTDGSIKKTLPQEWRIVALELEGISATLEDTQTSHAAGTYAWRKQAIPILPAGVFVWRDELSEQYADSVRHMEHYEVDSSGMAFRVKTPELAFDIEVWPQWESLVLEGFAPAKVPPQAQESPPDTPAPEPAPAAPPEAVLMPAQATVMKKAGLVKACMRQWPTIEADLGDAARNGLSVARIGSRGWDERKALEWARSKGKLHMESIAPTPEPADPMAAHFGRLGKLPSHRHGG